ncbi:MAG: DNA polymerase IV [Bacillota bacterium]
MKKDLEILLCDLDAFFASVEQLDHPELKGKALLVGGDPKGRGVVSTCTYEARKYGIRSAMPMKRALELCPHAIVLRGNMPRYKEMSGMVRQIFERFTPDIEFISIDEAYLAVKEGSGLNTAWEIHRAVGEELHLPISVGVSVNKLLAKIACELAKPNNVSTLWPGEIKDTLWPLPVRKLPGVGPVTEEKLLAWGIETIGNLAAYPEETLAGLFGEHGRVMAQYAQGLDNRKLECEHEAKSISEETTFAEDIFDPEYLGAVILELSAGVGYRLRKAKISAKTITIKLRYKDFRTITRSKTMPEAVHSDFDIYRVARKLFQNHRGNPPWRLVGVQASGFEEGTQLSLFTYSRGEQREKELMQIKDRLRDKYGSEVIFQGKKLTGKNKPQRPE